MSKWSPPPERQPPGRLVQRRGPSKTFQRRAIEAARTYGATHDMLYRFVDWASSVYTTEELDERNVGELWILWRNIDMCR